jgi:methyltransferase
MWYSALIAAIAVERVAELVLSVRHARWAMARGAVEVGSRHYPVMVVLHAALLVGAVAEVWLLRRPFVPAFSWAMLAAVGAAQGLRWWCIGSLGRQWNTRVIVVPGLPLVSRGPYRWLRHPNYVAVVIEGLALPLVHSAWLTAISFTMANLLLLVVRIRVEERALATVCHV